MRLAGVGTAVGLSSLTAAFPDNNSENNDGKSKSEPGPQKKRKIIVIGAGIAGLSAARALSDKDCDVSVLEARTRIGGRVWTDHSSLQSPIDLGASWIHGIEKNPIYALATDNGIQLTNCDYFSKPQIFGSAGPELALREISEQATLLGKIRKIVYEEQDRLQNGKDKSVEQALEGAVARLALSKEQRKLLEHTFAIEIENDYATEASHLSLKEWDKDHAFAGPHVIFPGGYSQIAEKLAQGLNIKLECPVREVNFESSQIKVSSQAGESFEADLVLITLPLGVLKRGSVKFTPDLPDKKIKAIGQLGVGVFDKLYMRFPKRFWSLEPTWIEYAGDKAREWPVFFNLAKFKPEPILAAFNVGDFALKLEKKKQSEIVTDAMKVLRLIYGPDIPEPIASRESCWGADPYACGSYSYIPVGTPASAYDEIAEPVNDRLFFAGEACSSKNFSTVHAAYISGLKAAKALARQIAR